jgi:serine/threonine-protein kinase
MGVVYEAHDAELDRNVALKVLNDPQSEAKIIARLEHPGIVPVHDAGVLPDGRPFYTMKLVRGTRLDAFAQSEHSRTELLRIFARVCEAVAFAHANGVVHRDLKPENIMLISDHERLAPRVLDFGLAKLTVPIGEDDATLAQSNHSMGVVGTLMYMAPEILTGHAAEPRSDQYSLALIAYELLAGEHPLAGATDLASVVRGHTEAPIVPIRKRAPDVPAHVEEALTRALAKRAEDRFESVTELISAIGTSS